MQIVMTFIAAKKSLCPAKFHVNPPFVCCFCIVLAAEKTAQILLKVVLEMKSDIRLIRSQLNDIKEQIHDVSSVEAENEDYGELRIPCTNFSDVESIEAEVSADSSIKRLLVLPCLLKHIFC